VSIKRKNNYDDVKHVEKPHEASLYFLPLDEVEVVHPYSPPTHKVEEETSLNDEESKDPVEVSLTYVFPKHKDKETFIFSHTDGLVKEPLYMVDENIESFIHMGRCIWDFVPFTLDRDPFYDIEGSS
jgi:hypothetical protein